ncbi:hypothetical protein FACS1894199_14880 [Bacteroidia bacterium]|nr:hypothetical protein FACS1894199_14880 [Bacteroidia bacterium]
MSAIIRRKAHFKIIRFYYNAAKKWKHAWSMEDSHRYIDKVHDEAYKVGTQLPTKKDSVLYKWKNYKVAYSKKTGWYFAFRIVDDTIYIEDAENYRNMSKASVNL